MVAWKLSALLVLSLRALGAVAGKDDFKEVIEDPEELAQTPNLDVKISTSFPQAEIFGVKLINGHATQAVLSVSNNEADPVTVQVVGGSLFQDVPGQDSVILRNLSAATPQVQIPAGASETIPYSFSTEMHPQDVRLQLVAVILAKERYYTVAAYNETVSVVEAPTSIFDPQIIFLYLVLLSVFAGTVYFIYNMWLTTFFPQKKRGGKGGERAKKSVSGAKKVDPADQVSVVGADGPAVASGAKAYDESWIPAQHLQRPEAKRVRSGTPKTKVKS